MTAEQNDEVIQIFADQFPKSASIGPDFQRAGREKGQINGLNFVKIGWQGTKTPEGIKVHGVLYFCATGSTILALCCVDSEAHYQESQGLLNTSLMTFRRK